MTTVTYLDHSGFVLETGDAILVFDYYRDPSHALHKILDRNPSLSVTFFASHHHQDHFNPGIFELAQNHRRTYVLSNDIAAQRVPSDLNVQGMSHGDVVEDVPGCKRIKAYGSTDQGVSFYVMLNDGTTVFHAGDLNLWHWKDENTPQRVVAASRSFNKVLNEIASEVTAIHICMFPVDPRQGTDFAQGAQKFVDTVTVDYFLPMHFWGEYRQACLFSAYINNPHTQCLCLHTPGEHAQIQ